MSFDTIIIGAGMSGLAAGIRLAYYDRRVCILERHTTIGGLNSFYRLRGREYDVGLHAVTNYAPRGARRGPLPRLLRQLRLDWDDFALMPQLGSTIAFPGVKLDFSNQPDLLEGEIRRAFPGQADRFRQLVAQVADFDQIDFDAPSPSARQVVAECLDDPLLAEMLFCPLLFYGGCRARDLDFREFSILFRSVFLEGLARPLAGIRVIVKSLVRKYKELGGELRLRSGVSRIVVRGGRAVGVVLDDGTELACRAILSSAGWPETAELCEGALPQPMPEPGEISFVESISILGAQPCSLGYDRSVLFYNDSEAFHYERPDDLADLRSGVVCSPNNFAYEVPPADGVIRLTVLANYGRWIALDESSYQAAKLAWCDRMAAAAARFIPDFRSAVVERDVFTPKTIRRYTGRLNGAVYGAPQKRHGGTTHVENLFLCGADQGLVGIVGAMTSGLMMANKHLLRG